ncbi:MAG: fluoride efflux transporter CrcB [Planctomycetaceae bacterium]
MHKIVLIALGGALGSVLRYVVQGSVQRWSGGLFPWGTLAVNVSGCLLMGFLWGMLSGPVLMRDEYRLGILVGILGGYTTFSAFGLETFTLAGDRQFWPAAANIVVSCGLGLGAVWFGVRVAQRFFGV